MTLMSYELWPSNNSEFVERCDVMCVVYMFYYKVAHRINMVWLHCRRAAVSRRGHLEYVTQYVRFTDTASSIAHK
jgi:hypothetical protein